MNHIILMGRLTKDVEVRVTNGGVNGRSYAVFNLAIDRGKDRDGNDLGADFPRCIAWGRTAENMERYTANGCRVLVDGRLQTGKYQSNTGSTVYTTDVVANRVEFIDFRKDADISDDGIPAEFEQINEDTPF